MQIIKDKQLTENNWTFIADDSNLTDGDISVSLGRWKQDKARLLDRQGKIGVRLTATDEVAELVDDLDKISLIELDFPAFTNGRAFSQARLLRSRYDYQGEIRAVGGFMADQVFYLSRVGVNAFDLNDEKQLPVALSALNDFTVRYQASTN